MDVLERRQQAVATSASYLGVLVSNLGPETRYLAGFYVVSQSSVM
jgi:hypothetical protein